MHEIYFDSLMDTIDENRINQLFLFYSNSLASTEEDIILSSAQQYINTKYACYDQTVTKNGIKCQQRLYLSIRQCHLNVLTGSEKGDVKKEVSYR